MKKIHVLLFSLSLSAAGAYAQQPGRQITGKVLSTLNEPIPGAVVSVTGSEDVTTDENGVFTINCKNPEDATFSVWAVGYYRVNQVLNNRQNLRVVMVPESQYKYGETTVLPFRINQNEATTSAENIEKNDFGLPATKIDRALAGQIAGLQVTRSSGMPGEGSYMNLRGIRSFVGNTAPLVVINGVPQMVDTNDSPVITGLSRDIFAAYNINDIANITVLKGAEAAMYGSLGANGVILIETDGATSDDLDTKVSYYGQFGMQWNNERIPLLSGTAYKSYLSDIGASYFAGNMDGFYEEFPFFEDPNGKYAQYYNNHTDWQDEIYQKGFMTDNLFRVEGGDAIAKYDLSIGYSQEQGVIKNTDLNRYHSQLNGNFLVNRNFEIFATVGLAYLDGTYQEQGMDVRTNPMLAAYAKSPLLSPYEKDDEGRLTPIFSSYRYGISENLDFAVSNPLAIVETLDANNHAYDINIKAGFTYTPIQDLKVSGVFGLYYNYNREHVFVPGKSDMTIVPVTDSYGEEQNTVRDGVAKAMNYFYNLSASYDKSFGSMHKLSAVAGFQALMTKQEYDGAFARNTTNDYYQMLGNRGSDLGAHFKGYLEEWNWMNFYAHADYTYGGFVNVGLNMSVDGSSATGKYTNRFRVYPGVSATWMLKNMDFLIDRDWINRLDVRAEWSMTGNTRFSSNYGRSYYSSLRFQSLSSIVRNQIPNTHLKPETTSQVNLSVDASFLRNRLALGVDYYRATTSDVVLNMPKSPVYGSSAYYANCGKIESNGVELSMQASVLRFRDFEWIVGGNIAWTDNEVTSLGGVDKVVNEFSDGAKVASLLGGNPYEFYGLQANGVYASQAEAEADGLVNASNQAYAAGDVRYVDQNSDGRIDNGDLVSLGSATPDYFGGFYTHFRYKGFGLSAEFSYTKGNMAYNAVRRSLESVSSFDNQSVAALNRWSVEGQKTDVPRATYGDAIGNNDFSSRWIEDASFLRMKNVTLSYTFDKPVWNFFRGGTLYVTGENLWTLTEYLGLDPEFAYSANTAATQGFDYAKAVQPRAVKFGINLKF